MIMIQRKNKGKS